MKRERSNISAVTTSLPTTTTTTTCSEYSSPSGRTERHRKKKKKTAEGGGLGGSEFSASGNDSDSCPSAFMSDGALERLDHENVNRMTREVEAEQTNLRGNSTGASTAAAVPPPSTVQKEYIRGTRPEDEKGLSYMDAPRPCRMNRSSCVLCRVGTGGESFLIPKNIETMKNEIFHGIIDGTEALGARRAFIHYEEVRNYSKELKRTVKGYQNFEDLPEWSAEKIYEHFSRHTLDPVWNLLHNYRKMDYVIDAFYHESISVQDSVSGEALLHPNRVATYNSMLRDQSKAAVDLHKMLASFGKTSKKPSDYTLGWSNIASRK